VAPECIGTLHLVWAWNGDVRRAEYTPSCAHVLHTVPSRVIEHQHGLLAVAEAEEKHRLFAREVMKF